MNTKIIALALTAALILSATVLSGACVEKVTPCEEFDVFAEIYAASCPAVEAWATECASNVHEIPTLEQSQDFDWCVDCYRDCESCASAPNDEPDKDCRVAPLGASCPTLLNTTLDASCTWPIPAP